TQITKGIESSSYLPYECLSIGAGTHIVEKNDLQTIKSFGYSLLQNEVKKEYELRVFYVSLRPATYCSWVDFAVSLLQNSIYVTDKICRKSTADVQDCGAVPKQRAA
ncbi:MAG: hypothetical protein ACQETH_17685, partial [Candidatus Rifleibacteriota bacterium]